MTIKAHAAEIEQGDYVTWINDGERKRIEAIAIIRDCGVVHVRSYAHVVTFPAMYPVEIIK